MLLFGLYFPEPFPLSTRGSCIDWLKWILIVPLAADVILDTIVRIGAIKKYSAVFPLQRFLSEVQTLTNVLKLAAIVVMFVSLAAKFQIASSIDARRRLRVLFAGSVISIGPFLILIIISDLLGVDLERYFPKWLYYAVYIFFYGFAPNPAYVILVHRAMDVRVVPTSMLAVRFGEALCRDTAHPYGYCIGCGGIFLDEPLGS